MEYSEKMQPAQLITRQNAIHLPAEESLVRASAEPTTPQETLLRAASASEETPKEELLRPTTGEG